MRGGCYSRALKRGARFGLTALPGLSCVEPARLGSTHTPWLALSTIHASVCRALAALSRARQAAGDQATKQQEALRAGKRKQ